MLETYPAGSSTLPASAITARLTMRRGRVAGMATVYHPAMQAGITNELWMMERLYDEVMG